MKRYARWVGRLVVALLASWFLVCVVLAAAIVYVGTRDEGRRADVIVVLGASLARDGRPNPALTRRAEHAAHVWKRGDAPAILCTGGIGEGLRVRRSEADGCREILLREGVPATVIVLEESSTSTATQAARVREAMASRGWATAILVSDSYHMLRSRYLFRQQGVDVSLSAVPAGRTGPIFYLMSLVREIAALHDQVLTDHETGPASK